MSKKTSKPRKATAKLPLITAALICEKVLDEKNVHSAIRIIDTTTFHQDPSTLNLDKDTGIELGMTVFIIVMANGAKGEHECNINLRNPKGTVRKFATVKLGFKDGKDEHARVNIRIPIRFSWQGVGIYWFEIDFGGVLVSRIPLQVFVDTSLEKAEK